MSGAMQVQEINADLWQGKGTDGVPNLQQVAAERLAAHRNRRAAVAAQEAEFESRTRQHRDAVRQAAREDYRRGASAVRDTVKARYERRESYREFLAAEAERAISQAQAEADVAARSARAVAEAQMQLLEELDSFHQADPGPREFAFAQAAAATRGELAHALADIVMGAQELIAEPPTLTVMESAPTPVVEVEQHADAVREISASGLTVRLFEDIPVVVSPRAEELSLRKGAEATAVRFTSRRAADEIESFDMLEQLEEEIEFRRAPEFPRAVAIETQGIPGNLIEFPRELVAPRRARPRLAEGPLRDEGGEPQLRIFEVDAVQPDPEPMFVDPQTVPDWQSMMLESALTEPNLPAVAAHTQITLPPQTAPIERRLMAAAFDGCIVAGAWMAALATVAEICGPALRTLPLPMVVASALGFFALFAIVYQVLFFSLSDGTPGMRWARIALCTFGDSNPTRRAMRRRVFSTVLAACPLGLGLAWIWMDNDGMGWHDRMSRMYQRAY